MFDGLDEVADPQIRAAVVEEVSRGLSRMRSLAASIQAVITSRPAAFANSPGLPESQYPHFQLGDLNFKIIKEYADKWLGAKKLQGREGGDVKRILKDKLDQPHIRDLARNPMQLAILLSLIHTRGASLPDKRTALYDSYTELFFSRESEKSVVVRDNRDLLIDIHRYIAWLLHSEAQRDRSSGSISEERLRQVVRDYLKREDQDESIANQLFDGMVERVVALVSRVQGTFEFEVQPLREYFAARYLYETAPYSPPGNEKNGTKPDRFDALARDFYWLNVARFFCGCFSKGELPSLVDRLSDLASDPVYKHTIQWRFLATRLLSDWVFSQHAKSVIETVKLVIRNSGLKELGAPRSLGRQMGDLLNLPNRTGRDELVNRCMDALGKIPRTDHAQAIADLLIANSTQEELSSLALTTIGGLGKIEEKSAWLRYSVLLGVLGRADHGAINAAIGRIHRAYLSSLIDARRWDVLGDEANFPFVVTQFLTEPLGLIWTYSGRKTAQSVLEAFFNAINPMKYGWAHLNSSREPLQDLWTTNEFGGLHLAEGVETPPHEAGRSCMRILGAAQAQAQRPSADWVNDLSPWVEVAEAIRREFGDSPTTARIAVFAAGVRAQQKHDRDYSSLFDVGESICHRAFHAKRRARNGAWWAEQFNLVKSDDDRFLICHLILTWGSAGVLSHCADEVERELNALSEERWLLLFYSLQQSCAILSRESYQKRRFGSLRVDVALKPGTRILAGLTTGMDEDDLSAIFDEYFISYKGKDPAILQICHSVAAFRLYKGNKSAKLLKFISNQYTAKKSADAPESNHRFYIHRQSVLAPSIVKAVLANPEIFPDNLVARAQEVDASVVMAQTIPLSKLAENQHWQFI